MYSHPVVILARRRSSTAATTNLLRPVLGNVSTRKAVHDNFKVTTIMVAR